MHLLLRDDLPGNGALWAETSPLDVGMVDPACSRKIAASFAAELAIHPAPDTI